MPEPFDDQAASLRRLLGGAALHSALFAGTDTGIGQTALVANAAQALAHAGRAVLVIDAQPQLRSGARWFSLVTRGDLAEVLAGGRRLDEVMLHAAGGVTWLPAARLRPAAQAGGPGGARVLAELAARFDTVLIDVPADRLQHWWPAAAHAGAVLFGATARQGSITAAYAALKSLALQVGRRRYLWWAARATAAEPGELAYRNVAQTARHFLQVALDFAGTIPVDARVARCERLRRPLADAFPGSPPALACAALARRLGELPRPAEPAPATWAALLGLDESAPAAAGAGDGAARQRPAATALR